MPASNRARLALITSSTLAALVVAAGINWAQNEVNIQMHTFQDTRGVTVLAPSIDLGKDFTERTSARFKFGVDTISAASDSCARCHPRGASNTRLFGGVGITKKLTDSLKFTYGGEYSQERFYSAVTGSTSLAKEFNKANTTVAGGFAFSLNRPVLHPSDEAERQTSPSAYANVTQVLSKSTVAQVGYEYSQISGFQASPFLRTSVNGTMLVGNAPDSRTRHTASARLRQALPAETYLEADYRRYHDTWSIDSDTVSVGLSKRFSPQFVIGGTYRYYNQTGAYFYKPSYTGEPLYYTGDFRLSPFKSGTFTGKATYTPASGAFGLPDGSGFDLQYDRYHGNNGFDAAIFSFGLRIPLK